MFSSLTLTVLVLQVDRDIAFVQDAGLQLKYAVNTHCHADHITGTGALKRQLPQLKSVISAASKCKADVLVKPGDHVRGLKSSLALLCMTGWNTVQELAEDSDLMCLHSWSLGTQASKCLQRLVTQADALHTIHPKMVGRHSQAMHCSSRAVDVQIFRKGMPGKQLYLLLNHMSFFCIATAKAPHSSSTASQCKME